MIYLFSGLGADKRAFANLQIKHGTKDRILWYNCMKNAVGIENGGHLMIVNKAQAVQKLLDAANS